MVKVISLSDEAYSKLSMIKRDRSFSEVVVNLIDSRKKRSIIDFAGIWSKEEGEKIKKEIAEDRKKQKMREVKF
jgi:predicted CopG family antitoxin